MKVLGGIFLGIVALVVLLGLSWVFTGNEFFLYKYFAPKRAEVERQVFENTKSYNQGMIQELQNMQFEYIKATPEQKQALGSIILHRAADFDENKLPVDLREFIKTVKHDQLYSTLEKGK